MDPVKPPLEFSCRLSSMQFDDQQSSIGGKSPIKSQFTPFMHNRARKPLQNISNLDSPENSPSPRISKRSNPCDSSSLSQSPGDLSPYVAPAERTRLIENNQDLIGLYTRGRSSVGGRASMEGADLLLRIAQLECQIATSKDTIQQFEISVEQLKEEKEHWQKMAQAASQVLCKDSEEVVSSREITCEGKTLQKLRKQNQKLEFLIDELCKHVDTETTLLHTGHNSDSPSVKCFRKSLEMMATVQEIEHQEDDDSDERVWNEVAFIVKLKKEAEARIEEIAELMVSLEECKQREYETQKTLDQAGKDYAELSNVTEVMTAQQEKLFAAVQELQKAKQSMVPRLDFMALEEKIEAIICERDNALSSSALKEEELSEVKAELAETLDVQAKLCCKLAELETQMQGVSVQGAEVVSSVLEGCQLSPHTQEMLLQGIKTYHEINQKICTLHQELDPDTSGQPRLRWGETSSIDSSQVPRTSRRWGNTILTVTCAVVIMSANVFIFSDSIFGAPRRVYYPGVC